MNGLRARALLQILNVIFIIILGVVSFKVGQKIAHSQAQTDKLMEEVDK
jgi:type IV secretory pathway TrbD component